MRYGTSPTREGRAPGPGSILIECSLKITEGKDYCQAELGEDGRHGRKGGPAIIAGLSYQEAIGALRETTHEETMIFTNLIAATRGIVLEPHISVARRLPCRHYALRL